MRGPLSLRGALRHPPPRPPFPLNPPPLPPPRELNHMLKAWEAMRLGKDAQIAALMERCAGGGPAGTPALWTGAWPRPRAARARAC
jgi:hypothetical protein